ncbi:hypothetical protein BSKO_03212 [Bryopsis sp. KO-2023]|nr:hypothetical protein BSKO_03212 [Bryopsis sp. KO-2023]
MGRTTMFFLVLTILCITTQGRVFGTLNLSAAATADTSSSSSSFSSTSGSGTTSSTSSSGAHASASAFSFADGSEGEQPTVAEATSTSTGPGAESEAVSVARDGATVKTESNAISEGEGDVKVSTVAEGEGPYTVIEKENTVVGIDNGSIAVELFVQKLKDGVNPLLAAQELIAMLQNSESTVVTDGLAIALEQEGDISQVFTIAVEGLLDKQGCEEFKKPFQGELSRFLAVSVLSSKIEFCLFPACKRIESAESCCGAAQKEDRVCACG